MYRYIYIVLILLSNHSCILFQNNDKSLGNGYYIWVDNTYKSIAYNLEGKKESGLPVIDIYDNVLIVLNNDEYISLKTFNTQSKKINYWVIDKNIKISYEDFPKDNEYGKYVKSVIFNTSDSLSYINFADSIKMDLKFW